MINFPKIPGQTIVVTLESYNSGTTMQVKVHANGQWSGFFPGSPDDDEAIIRSVRERVDAEVRAALRSLRVARRIALKAERAALKAELAERDALKAEEE